MTATSIPVSGTGIRTQRICLENIATDTNAPHQARRNSRDQIAWYVRALCTYDAQLDQVRIEQKDLDVVASADAIAIWKQSEGVGIGHSSEHMRFLVS
jgi:hypothetical protein